MIVSSQLLLWLQENAYNKLPWDIEIIENSKWKEEWNLPFFSATANIYEKNKEKQKTNLLFQGSGIGTTITHSYIKAVTEAIERSLLKEEKEKRDQNEDFLTTNGLALHDTFEKAKQGAIFELIERDAFFCHWLTGIPMEPINYKTNSFSIHTQEIINTCKIICGKYSIQLHLCLMKAPFPAVCAFSFGHDSPQPFQLSLGLGCSSSLDKAIFQALGETLRSWSVLLYNTKNENPILNKDANSTWSFETHGKYAAHDPWYQHYTKSLISQTNPISTHSDIFQPQINIYEILMPSSLLSIPLKACRAESCQLQNIWVGPTIEKYINFSRLKEFCGKSLLFEDLPQKPHPLP